MFHGKATLEFNPPPTPKKNERKRVASLVRMSKKCHLSFMSLTDKHDKSINVYLCGGKSVSMGHKDRTILWYILFFTNVHLSYSSYDKHRNRCYYMYTMQIKNNSVLPSEMLHEFRKSSNMGPERQTNVSMCDELRQFGEKSTIHGLENILGKSSHCYRKYVR